VAPFKVKLSKLFWGACHQTRWHPIAYKQCLIARQDGGSGLVLPSDLRARAKAALDDKMTCRAGAAQL